jgi:hypothetical protein
LDVSLRAFDLTADGFFIRSGAVSASVFSRGGEKDIRKIATFAVLFIAVTAFGAPVMAVKKMLGRRRRRRENRWLCECRQSRRERRIKLQTGVQDFRCLSARLLRRQCARRHGAIEMGTIVYGQSQLRHEEGV